MGNQVAENRKSTFPDSLFKLIYLKQKLWGIKPQNIRTLSHLAIKIQASEADSFKILKNQCIVHRLRLSLGFSEGIKTKSSCLRPQISDSDHFCEKTVMNLEKLNMGNLIIHVRLRLAR